MTTPETSRATNGKVEHVSAGEAVVMSYGDMGRLGALHRDDSSRKWAAECGALQCSEVLRRAPTRRDAAERLAVHYRTNHDIYVFLY